MSFMENFIQERRESLAREYEKFCNNGFIAIKKLKLIEA